MQLWGSQQLAGEGGWSPSDAVLSACLSHPCSALEPSETLHVQSSFSASVVAEVLQPRRSGWINDDPPPPSTVIHCGAPSVFQVTECKLFVFRGGRRAFEAHRLRRSGDTSHTLKPKISLFSRSKAVVTNLSTPPDLTLVKGKIYLLKPWEKKTAQIVLPTWCLLFWLTVFSTW